MRISVCEFLRLRTNQNWYYMRPGTWANSDHSLKAIRYEDQPDTIHLVRKSGKPMKSLHYFEGLPSHEVRKIANSGNKKRR